MSAYEQARRQIDAAHAADPERLPDGSAAELIYANRLEEWVQKLVPDASEILRLAARCQHLERWKTPRSSFPQDRTGYLLWRKSLYKTQADRAKSIFLETGISHTEANEAYAWISKTGLKTNSGTQALEDAAVLVFLEHEITGFAASHPDYTREKFIGILRKSWNKITPAAQAFAVQLPFPPTIASLIHEAVSGAP